MSTHHPQVQIDVIPSVKLYGALGVAVTTKHISQINRQKRKTKPSVKARKSLLSLVREEVEEISGNSLLMNSGSTPMGLVNND